MNCGSHILLNARMIGEWQESLIIHPISDLVTHCRWLLVVGDVVVVYVNDKMLVHCTVYGKTSAQFVILSNV